MESGPALFTGTVFAVFGAALLVWTGVRVRAGAPVVREANPPLALTLSLLFGAAFLLIGGRLLAYG
ncbi:MULTISPECIES: hypothetical protein [Streptomyces]|uniref:Uncharacterized protein n=1 Tax=Streptomyces lycii TaxID=2654337 RepID=A0ABQ7FEZ0_9ACTN|nr:MULTISPECIES: hypothetical protein [Streptomyces]KAF4407604.1 hypothetical protein GCU69_18935 [Streptomyces lycii]PGH49632.1 hypothetical protein CRI70_16505 [Streptomyces sp. Ru87]